MARRTMMGVGKAGFFWKFHEGGEEGVTFFEKKVTKKTFAGGVWPPVSL
jgi:hypothetical protein